jgi:curli biogenesis system outer membrane secretion channel CsgG
MSRRVLLPVLALFVAVSATAQPPKKRVAVFNFDYGTVQSGVSAIFGTNVDVGKGIADLLVDKLVQGGVYSVIERKALDKILAEQNFSNSDRANPASAAKLGQILGVDAIIIGSITEFGRDDKSTNVGGGGFGSIAGRYGLGGVGHKESKAVVAITARVINTDTAEILSSITGKGESTRSGTSLLGGGGNWSGGGGGGVNMGSSNFAATILGEATTKAVATVATGLQADAQKLPTKVVKLEGLVADVSGDTLIINIGSKAGVKVGDKLTVRRPGREIRDPASGKVLKRIEETLGEVTITEVDESSCVGKYSGANPPKVGDTARN